MKQGSRPLRENGVDMKSGVTQTVRPFVPSDEAYLRCPLCVGVSLGLATKIYRLHVNPDALRLLRLFVLRVINSRIALDILF
jgi:hypothetical protein